MKQIQNKQYVEIPPVNQNESERLAQQLTFNETGQTASVQEVEPSIMDLMGDMQFLVDGILKEADEIVEIHKGSNQELNPESKTLFLSICEALVDKVTQKKQIVEEYKEKKDPFWERHKEIVKEEKEILSDIEKDEGKLRDAVLEYLRKTQDVPKPRNISLNSSWSYKIEDPESLPEKFKTIQTVTVIDEDKIKDLVSKLGDEAEEFIPGIKVTEKQTVMVKSREVK